MMPCLYPRLGLFTGLLINHCGVFVSQTGFIYWFTPQSSWHVCILDWVYLLVYSSITTACLYPRLGLFTGLLINHYGMSVSQIRFIYWFTHQSSWHVCILDWVYLLVYSSIIMACLYPRLGLCIVLPINHHGVFVSQTGFIYWFTHPLSWHVCIPDCAYLLVYSSIMMACLYPRLGLFTGLLINHHGVFVSQTGFIYWFTHQSSWCVCIPEGVYLLVYSSIIMVCLYPRLGLFTGLLINHDGAFVSQTGFMYWFTHESPWHVCISDWVYLLVYSSIMMVCLYPRLGIFAGLLINHHGMFVS